MSGQVLVVGAGVSGLATALALLRRGHGVTVLERGRSGGESSWAGGGILSPLLPWDYADAVSALALRSMAGYADWVAEIQAASGRDAEFWRCGMLALEVTEPDRALAWCAAHGMAAERGCPDALHVASDTSASVIASEARQSRMPAEPATPGSPRPCGPRDDDVSVIASEARQSRMPAGSTTPGSPRPCVPRDDGNRIWLPEVAQVRNPRLVAALHAAVQRLGGVIREDCPATGVLAHDGRVTAVRTATETFPAERVVLATGAWAGLGLAGLAAAPHIRPVRGQMLLFRLQPGALETILYRNGLYLIPRRDGHVLVGSTLEDAGFDKSTDAATRRRLHLEAAELLPALAALRPVRHWAGLRPGSPDNIPLIDRHPDFDNVFVNTGHYRYGVTMAPASAELLADVMEGKAPALDPQPYRWQAALERAW